MTPEELLASAEERLEEARRAVRACRRAMARRGRSGAPAVRRVSRAEWFGRIEAVLAGRAVGLTRREIAAALEAGGYGFGRSGALGRTSVLLSQMKRSGRVVHEGRVFSEGSDDQA